MENYHANGKLLLSGEYAVLDGAKAIALPTKRGQKMKVGSSRGADLIWKSYLPDNTVWFESQISIFNFKPIKTTDEEISAYLAKLLKAASRLNSEFLSKWVGFKVETSLEFPLDWGFGSSSTLMYLVYLWSGLDENDGDKYNLMHLFFNTSNGSGYDIFCTDQKKPIYYQNADGEINHSVFEWKAKFIDQLRLVHLNHKQDSSLEVERYQALVKDRKSLANEITHISEAIETVGNLSDFGRLMKDHEQIISKAISTPTVQSRLFPDFEGQIKSLGAWGGDFILAFSDNGPQYVDQYFKSKNYHTIHNFEDMVIL